MKEFSGFRVSGLVLIIKMYASWSGSRLPAVEVRHDEGNAGARGCGGHTNHEEACSERQHGAGGHHDQPGGHEVADAAEVMTVGVGVGPIGSDGELDGPRHGAQSRACDGIDGELNAEREHAHQGPDDGGDDPLGDLGGVAAGLPKSVMGEVGTQSGTREVASLLLPSMNFLNFLSLENADNLITLDRLGKMPIPSISPITQ